MKKIIIATGIIISIISCKENKVELETPTSFDTHLMLQELCEEVIIPAHLAFQEESNVFQSKVIQFYNSPSKLQFETLKQSFTSMVFAYKNCELYNLGEVQNTFYHTRVEFSKAKISEIDKLIAKDDLSSLDIQTAGVSAKGILAMEYLLYGNNRAKQYEKFEDEGYRLLLKFYSEDLVEVSDKLTTFWGDRKEYAKTFYESKEIGVKSSLNVLVNKLINSVEKIRNDKLEAPIGINTNLPDSLKCIYQRSNLSLEAIKLNMKSIRSSFQKESFNGLFAYINYRKSETYNSNLASEILKIIVEIETDLESISGSLEKEIYNNQNNWDHVLEKYDQLLRILKVDLVNSLGIVMTFSDNDGD